MLFRFGLVLLLGWQASTLRAEEITSPILADKDLSKGVCVGIFNHSESKAQDWHFLSADSKINCKNFLDSTCEELQSKYADFFFNLQCDSLLDIYWVQSYKKFSATDPETNLSLSTRLGTKTCLRKSMERTLLEKCSLTNLWTKASDEHKDSELFVMAAEMNYLPVLEKLIKKKHKVNMKNKEGKSAIEMAIFQCRHEAVDLLIANGANTNEKNRFKRTLLMEAALCNDPAVIKSLLIKKTDLDTQDKYGETALMMAAESGHEAVVRTLLAAGAKKEIQTSKKATALTKARRAGFFKIVELLSN